MERTVISSDEAPRAIGPYSHAVRAGDLFFLSGQIALDPRTGELVAGDVRAQARQVMTNVGAVLASCGLGWANVVKTTIFLADIADFAAVNEVYGSVFEGMKPPARSTIAARDLPRGARVEIDAIACT